MTDNFLLTPASVMWPFALPKPTPPGVIVEETADQYKKRAQRRAQSTLTVIAAKAKAAGVPCGTVHVEHDDVYKAIIDSAKTNGCDLITMASHGRRGISALVLGSETVKVLTHSKIPVLVHR